MDEYLILEFEARAQAETVLSVINDIASGWCANQGFTIDSSGLVGRNAASGKDRPEACRTITWAHVQESPTGTFYFASPSNDSRFANWRDELLEKTDTGMERVFPATWALIEESI